MMNYYKDYFQIKVLYIYYVDVLLEIFEQCLKDTLPQSLPEGGRWGEGKGEGKELKRSDGRYG